MKKQTGRSSESAKITNNSLIDAGAVLQTNHGIKSFKLLGKYYGTNKHRKKIYSYDDKSWKIVEVGLFWKVKQVWNGTAKQLV